MGSSIFFSVIIPIYNVEEYLEKCIDSVLSQTFKDYEVILVDDGSPDRCGKICDRYATDNENVIVIHKPNGGSSDARNKGLEVANGEYVIFLDSDDYWNDFRALELLYNKLKQKKSDVILFGCKDFDAQKQEFIAQKYHYDLDSFDKPKEQVLKYLLENDLFPGAAWILTVKRRLLIDNNIQFRVGVKAEDIEWLVWIFTKAKKINAINSSFYVYLKNRSNSITSQPDKNSISGILHAINSFKNSIKNSESAILLSFLQYEYLIAIMIFSKIKKDKAELYNELCMHRDLLSPKYVLSNKVKYSLVIIRLAGMKRGAVILDFIKKKLM